MLVFQPLNIFPYRLEAMEDIHGVRFSTLAVFSIIFLGVNLTSSGLARSCRIIIGLQLFTKAEQFTGYYDSIYPTASIQFSIILST